MKRRPGAPRGNHNALKHGFYSRQFTRQESTDLSQPIMGCMQDEIIFFKVLIDRISRRMSREAASSRHLASRGHEAPGKPAGAHPLSFQESVLNLQVVAMAISRLNSFYQTNRLIDITNDDQVIDFLRERGFTEQQIRLEWYGGDAVSSSHTPLSSRASNSITHGFYASEFTPEELDRVSRWSKKDLKDEIALLRILIKRTYASILHHEMAHSDDDEADRSAQIDCLHAYKILIYAASCLERLERSVGATQRVARPPLGILNRALQEIHAEMAEKKSQGLPVFPQSQSP